MLWIRTALFATFMSLAAQANAACETAICQVDPDALALTRLITFDDQRATFGPGILLDDVLTFEGVRFGEKFVGQTTQNNHNHDEITGQALAPLTPVAGPKGQSMSLVRMGSNIVLNGYGPAGFPRRDAQGEGAISVWFERDQSAAAFDLRGGEGGNATIMFLRRDGSVIAQLQIGAVQEYAVGFQRRQGTADIAGFVLSNVDPQGLAIDNVRFEPPLPLS